jgi:hypothetical protein
MKLRLRVYKLGVMATLMRNGRGHRSRKSAANQVDCGPGVVPKPDSHSEGLGDLRPDTFTYENIRAIVFRDKLVERSVARSAWELPWRSLQFYW